VTLKVHWLKEIDTPAFKHFLSTAVDKFLKHQSETNSPQV
jgi:hypothetical protein